MDGTRKTQWIFFMLIWLPGKTKQGETGNFFTFTIGYILVVFKANTTETLPLIINYFTTTIR